MRAVSRRLYSWARWYKTRGGRLSSGFNCSLLRQMTEAETVTMLFGERDVA